MLSLLLQNLLSLMLFAGKYLHPAIVHLNYYLTKGSKPVLYSPIPLSVFGQDEWQYSLHFQKKFHREKIYKSFLFVQLLQRKFFQPASSRQMLFAIRSIAVDRKSVV